MVKNPAARNILQVETLDAKDVRSFSALAKKIILESPYYSDFAKKECTHDFYAKKIRKDLKDRNTLLMVAKYGGRIIGFIRGYFDGGVSSGIFWLQWIGVEAASRKMGIASKMLESLTRKLKTDFGAHKVVCVIRPENKTSIELFENNNYRKITLLKKHWYKEDYLLYYKFI